MKHLSNLTNYMSSPNFKTQIEKPLLSKSYPYPEIDGANSSFSRKAENSIEFACMKM